MKKLNKFFAVLVALAMVLSLTAVSAFAATSYTDGALVGGTESAPATGVITKALQMPTGTSTPATVFNFTWTQVKDETDKGIENTDILSDAKLGKTIRISENQKAATDADSIKTVIGVADIVETDEGGNYVTSTFPKAGRYAFDVMETANTNSTIDAETNKDETLTYSDEKYRVTIDVAQGENGLYIENISVQKYTKSGETYTLDGDKENPSNTITGDGEDQVVYGSGFKFTNTYVKTQNVTPDGKDPSKPTGDDEGLYIQKTVKAKEGDTLTEADKAAPFTFTVTVAKPSLSDATTYTAQIITLKDDGTGIKEGTTATTETFTLATETTPATTAGACTKTITLKHNQRLVFTDLDVGATYEVAETEDAGYTPSYVKTTAGTAATSVNGTSTSGTIAEADDSVAYTNTSKKSSKPTGILISNLPYIALALVAIGGLVAYVVVRRKADDEA